MSSREKTTQKHNKMYQPILVQCHISIPTENFQGVQKCDTGLKWVKNKLNIKTKPIDEFQKDKKHILQLKERLNNSKW